MEWLQDESTLVLVLVAANIAQWRRDQAREKSRIREKIALYEQAEARERSHAARLEEATDLMRGVQRAVIALRSSTKAAIGHLEREITALRDDIRGLQS